MKVEALVIDADGHILEPPDLWEKYLEPKYRPQAITIRVGDDGYEYLQVAGKRAAAARNSSTPVKPSNCASASRRPKIPISKAQRSARWTCRNAFNCSTGG